MDNILLVANYESDVGYAWWLMENYWVAIANYFSRKGCQTILIYPKINSIPDNIARSNIKIIEHDYSDWSKNSQQKLKNILQSNSIKHVYFTDKEYYSLKYFKLRTWGIKRIIIHDHKPGERPYVFGIKRILKNTIHRLGIFSADLYIGVSYFVYLRMLNNACLPPNLCAYVLNGIQPIEIKKEDEKYVNKTFHLPDSAKIIVSTGRASKYKGIDFLIECAKIILDNDPNGIIYFLHCGDGPDLQHFKHNVEKKGLTGRFIFAGKRNDVRKILPSCHIGIQASLGEAFSLSILEYLSAGLATIIPDNCGNREAVMDGETGYLYTPGNHKYVINTIKKLLLDENCRRIIGTKARESVAKKFTIDRANKELTLLLDKYF